MTKVFISYARDGSHGQNLAAAVQEQLRSAGFEVFRDVIGLKPGDVWYHKLEFELESSDVVVLVVSEKVRRSKWVHNEVSMAEEIGIPVIPVLAERIRSPLWLRHLQVLDCVNWFDLKKLVDSMAAHSVSIEPTDMENTEGTVQALSGISDDVYERLSEGDRENLNEYAQALLSNRKLFEKLGI